MKSPSVDTAAPIPPDQVRTQLAAILASPLFASSPRLSRFLEYVVEQTLQGNAAALKEYRVGVDVFERPDTYDPKTDPVVRVEARQLRFKLAEYYGVPEAGDVEISVPKGAYGARFERRAIAVEAPPPAVPVTTAAPQRRWWIGAIVLGVLAAGAYLGWPTRVPPPAETASIAVLPFVNFSGDPANEYFSDGLTDEITDELARIKTMRVIARNSAFQFKGKAVDAREAGRRLNVTTLLEGRVSRDGDRVKIAVQLERVSDGTVIWSQIYERQMAGAFTVQADVASRIAQSLKSASLGSSGDNSPSRRPVAQDRMAQDHYLRGRFEAEKMTTDALGRAVDHYQRAIERDPEYAAAWYGLAVAWHRNPELGAKDVPRISNAYRRALALDPGLADAHAGLALLAMHFDWDWARAEQELKEALALGPCAIAEAHYGVFLLTRNRSTEADEHLRRALDLDPLGNAILLNTAIAQFYAGHYEAARREWERHPGLTGPRTGAVRALAYEGRAAEAVDRFRAMRAETPAVALLEVEALAMVGNQSAARDLLRQLEKRPDAAMLPYYWRALAHTSVHEEEAAVGWLREAAAQHQQAVLFIAREPGFERLRRLPSFHALKARIGLPDR